MIILVIRHGEAGVGFRIDTVVDVRPIDADQNNLSAPLHRDLRCGVERDLCHPHLIGHGFASTAVISLLSIGESCAREQR